MINCIPSRCCWSPHPPTARPWAQHLLVPMGWDGLLLPAPDVSLHLEGAPPVSLSWINTWWHLYHPRSVRNTWACAAWPHRLLYGAGISLCWPPGEEGAAPREAAHSACDCRGGEQSAWRPILSSGVHCPLAHRLSHIGQYQLQGALTSHFNLHPPSSSPLSLHRFRIQPGKRGSIWGAPPNPKSYYFQYSNHTVR